MRRVMLLFAAVAMVGVGVLVAAWVLTRTPERTGTPAVAPPPDPSGAMVFVSDRGGSDAGYLINADGTHLKRFLPGASLGWVLWSPDGTKVAFTLPDNELDVINSDGSGQHRVSSPGTLAYEFAWSPDGRRIAFAGDDERAIFVVNADGSGRRRIAGGFSGSPAWSPDGSSVAFFRNDNNRFDLYVVRPDGGGEKLLARDVGGETPSWAPVGTQLAFTKELRGLKEAIFVVNAVGTGSRQLVETPASIENFAWAPDGRSIAFAASDYESSEVPAFVVDADGMHLRRIGTGTPVWSPSGTLLAFQRSGDIWVARPDGSGTRQITRGIPEDGNPFLPVWSPDGTKLAIGESGDIWVVNADGSGQRRLTQGSRYGYTDSDPAWQPRGVGAEHLGGTPISPGPLSDSLVSDTVLQTTHRIKLLAADGDRVAVAYQGPSTNCLEVWETRTGVLTRFHDNDCGGDWGSPLELALGGARLAWLDVNQGNFFYLDLMTATVAHPTAVDAWGIQVQTDVEQPQGGGDLHADGSLIVFDTWTGGCGVSDCFREGKTSGTLRRLVGSRTVALRSEQVGLTALGADADRIAVLRSDGPIELLRANGSLVVTLRFGPGEVRGAALQGSQIVVRNSAGLAVYDAGTGALEHRWRLQPGDTLQDLQSGIAVYANGRAIHLLRLSDGRTAVVKPPGTGLVRAQLEPPGLFYSYSATDPKRPGRVALLPFADLLRRLG
jgi:Tol biopolymer transport system component